MFAHYPKCLYAYGFVIVGCLLLACAQFFARVDAQQPQCPTIPKTGASNAWAQNSQVTVDIDSRYTPAQRECIMQGIRSWQGNNGANGSASGMTVTFTVGVGEISHNTVVLQQAPAGSNDIGSTTPVPGQDGHLDSATMSINRGVTSCDALSEAAAHEFGHTLGLGDYCTTTSGCANQTDSWSVRLDFL